MTIGIYPHLLVGMYENCRKSEDSWAKEWIQALQTQCKFESTNLNKGSQWTEGNGIVVSWNQICQVFLDVFYVKDGKLCH
jgi:hypothetical protein